MRKIKFLLLGLVLLFVVSCTETKEQKFLKTLENEYVQKKYDKENYEILDFYLIDSVTYLDNIDYRLKQYHEDVNYNRMSSTASPENEVYYLDEAKKWEEVRYTVDSVKQSLRDDVNHVTAYIYFWKFNTLNPVGEKVTANFYVVFSNEGNNPILQLTQNREEVLETPNDFPGYEEIKKRYNL